jgi:pimeloyl-ACP methyl ester carboxylesterase
MFDTTALNSVIGISSLALVLCAGQQSFAADSTPTSAPRVRYKTIAIEGLNVFYREAGPENAPVVLLLHGFPTSSFMFRDLIPKLATRYHVIAPDYPGFGQSDSPDTAKFRYTFDHLASLNRPGNKEVQLDLLLDYQNNLALYPKWQQYFRTSQPPMLIVWGKNDVCFPARGAEAYERDIKDLDFHLLDTGHFALEDSVDQIADLMLAFLDSHAGK